MDFSLNWFKSKKKEENIQKVDVPQSTTSYDVDPLDHNVEFMHVPYKSIKMVNDVLTVVLLDGTIIIKPSAIQTDFEKVVQATTIDEIMKVVTLSEVLEEKIKQKVEEEHLNVIREGLKVLQDLSDFVITDNSLYIKGTERSIPKLVTDAFITIVGKVSILEGDLEKNLLTDVTYTSLKKFWLKCCLNSSAQSAEDLYIFLSNHQFKIDRHGNFYAYRKVVKVCSAEDNSELVDFISNTYNKIKAVWKKPVSNYEVIEIN